MIRHLIHEVLDELDIKPKKHKHKHSHKRKYGHEARKYDRYHDDHDRVRYHDDDAWPRRGQSHRPGLLGTLLRLAEGERPYRHRSEYRYRTYRRRHEDWDD